MRTVEDFNKGPMDSMDIWHRTQLYSSNIGTILGDAAVEIAIVIITIAAATFAPPVFIGKMTAPIILCAKSYLATRLILPLFDTSLMTEISDKLFDNQKDIVKTLLLGFMIQMIVARHIFLFTHIMPIVAGSMLCIIVAFRESKASSSIELAKALY